MDFASGVVVPVHHDLAWGQTPRSFNNVINGRVVICHDRIKRLGYTEGKNLTVERWSTAGIAESEWPSLARRIVNTGPEIIVANGSRLVFALKGATSVIPIVFNASDPIKTGLVDSLSRPKGNVTGFASDAGVEMITKRLQYLSELCPRMTEIAYLGTEQTWSQQDNIVLEAATKRSSLNIIKLLVEGAVSDESVRRMLKSLAKPEQTGVVINAGTDFLSVRAAIAATALELHVATGGQQRELANAGCLVAYGPNDADQWTQIAGYADSILRGTKKPEDLPVQQPTLFDLVINKRTADALGLTIPLGLWVQATEIIE